MTITIKVQTPDDAADACREVADAIEQGYNGGIIGVSSDTWGIDE